MTEIEQYRDNKIKYINITEYKTIRTYPADNSTVFVILSKEINWDKIPKEYHRMTFQADELKYNILDNIMVPHHEKISMYDYNDNIFDHKNLPIIKSNDIVVRRMNFSIGDIIKITRKKSVYYRVVF